MTQKIKVEISLCSFESDNSWEMQVTQDELKFLQRLAKESAENGSQDLDKPYDLPLLEVRIID